MPEKQTPDIIYPTDTAEWRLWLEQNHQTAHSVWVIFKKKASGKKSLTWSESVDVALCFGWIDSVKVKVDEESSRQYFSRRKPMSTWSKINKDKVAVLTAAGLMTPAGLASVEVAKQNGSWTFLDEVDELRVPDDLDLLFKTQPAAEAFFLGLSNSNKKMILYWVISAKRTETRQKRIEEVVALAAQGKKPKHLPG